MNDSSNDALADIFAPFTQPLQLRAMTIPNRVAMAPMTRQFSPGGVPTPEVVAYYRKRAAGGVGLIVTEGAAVDHPLAADGTAIPHFYGEAALAGWRQVTEAVHGEGAVIVPQLWHQGPLRDPACSALPDQPGQRPSGLWGTPGVVSYCPSSGHLAQIAT